MTHQSRGLNETNGSFFPLLLKEPKSSHASYFCYRSSFLNIGKIYGIFFKNFNAKINLVYQETSTLTHQRRVETAEARNIKFSR